MVEFSEHSHHCHHHIPHHFLHLSHCRLLPCLPLLHSHLHLQFRPLLLHLPIRTHQDHVLERYLFHEHKIFLQKQHFPHHFLTCLPEPLCRHHCPCVFLSYLILKTLDSTDDTDIGPSVVD